MHTFAHYIVVIVLTATKKIATSILMLGSAYLGYLLFYVLPSPFNFIISLALILSGGGSGIAALFELFLVIVNPDNNVSQCPFCLSSKDPREILGINKKPA